VLWVTLAVGGCFSEPAFRSCSLECAAGDRSCPSGLSCDLATNLCAGEGVSCAGAPDAAGGAADASPIDALPLGTFLWQHHLGTCFPGVTLEPGGRVVVGGSMSGSFTLGDVTLTSAGGSDLFLGWYSPGGSPQTGVRYGGAGDEFGPTPAIDAQGYANFAGIYQGNTNLGGMDLPGTVNYQIYLAGYSAAGAHRWSVPFGNTGTAFAFHAPSTDGSGYVAAAGWFDQPITVGATVPHAGAKDVLFLRLRDDGSLATTRGYGTAADETGDAAVFDGLGSIIVAGTFTGPLQLGSTTLTTAGGRDVFVMKVNPGGDPQWAVSLGGAMDDDFPQLSVDAAGNPVLAAHFRGTLAGLSSDVTSRGEADVLLAKLSGADGAVLWAAGHGGPGEDRALRVTVGPDGDVAITGHFSATAGFGGATFASAGFLDAFVARYDSGGRHRWSHAAGSPADDRGQSVAIAPDGALYQTASFLGTIDFGGGPLSPAVGGVWESALLKYAGGSSGTP
jgi:hypothetical protein